ncbi:hypothetical protein EF918_28265 [Streptomyces sp. WAC06614]|nr:hypothetical protein EF918_28265 [Streptomyces sp. WAC06614]
MRFRFRQTRNPRRAPAGPLARPGAGGCRRMAAGAGGCGCCGLSRPGPGQAGPREGRPGGCRPG